MDTTAQLTFASVLLLTLTVNCYPTARRDRQQQEVSWDDVNVVAHGLLQLGQALREHVDKSRAQMRELNVGLRSVNATLQRLEGGGSSEGEVSWDRASGVEGLMDRVDRLERRVEEVIGESVLDTNSSDDGKAPFVQRIVAAQNRRIEQLMEKIRQQQDKLDKQSVHLQALQSKIGHKRMKSLKQRHDDLVQKGDKRQKGFARDCHELFVQGQRRSGVYTVQPESALQSFSVLCQMTPEGGWTVIQKRFDGSQSFDESWDSYKKGFGRLSGEFWLGLEHIHALSAQGRYTMQMEFSDWSGQSHVVSSEFRVGGEESRFSLRLTPQSGGLGDAFTTSAPGASRLPFSTADNDNDLSKENNCAQIHSGGWWFSSCGVSNLNGEFPIKPSGSRDMFWTTSEGQRTGVRATVMKIAPVSTQE